MAELNMSGQRLGPETEYGAPLGGPGDNANRGAWRGKSFNAIHPAPFDLDRYYDTAYRRAIRAADESSFGKMASLGDEMLSHHGLGLGSDAWMSSISSLNANKRKAYEEAADTALTKTVVAQQQKVNQDVATGKMNLDMFVQSTQENLKRMGVVMEASKILEAMDAAKRGDYIKLEEMCQEWANELATILENQENRKAGVAARELDRKSASRTSKHHSTASLIASGLFMALKIAFPAAGAIPTP